MNSHEFQQKLDNGGHAGCRASNILENSILRRFPVLPVCATGNEYAYNAQISVVAIGSFGAQIVSVLSENLAGVGCYEILFDHVGHDMADMDTLFTTVLESDLLFIVSDFCDHNCLQFFDHLAEIAKSAGVLVVGVVPDGDDWPVCSHMCLAERSRFVDTIFRISLSWQPNLVMYNIDQRLDLVSILIRQTITAISDLITQTSMVGIDFADVKAILKSNKVTGKIARMGVGLANDSERGKTASQQALDCLYAQRVKTSEAVGIIACLHGSSEMTIYDYEASPRIIHENVHPDANIIIGFLFSERMGDNVSVTIMMVEKTVTQE